LSISTIALNQLGVQAYQDKSYQSALVLLESDKPRLTTPKLSIITGGLQKHPREHTCRKTKPLRKSLNNNKVTDQDNEKKDLLSADNSATHGTRAGRCNFGYHAGKQCRELQRRRLGGIKSDENW
jgi:hypothetical protein